jgi:hypothetical protein
MTRKWTGAILAAVILAVAAPLVVLALLHALEGETQAAPAANGQEPTIKWDQLPDLTTTGVDVYAGNNGGIPPLVLADDFLCTETGPIGQIEFWGSWYQDILPQTPLSFTLSIHSDLPGPPYSQPAPGDPLWSHTYEVGPGGCVANLEQEGVPEGFYIPGPEVYMDPADDQVWHYTCFIPSGQEFMQQEGTIYWLDVQAVYSDTSAYFGWKTSLDHWQDDGTWATGAEPGPFTWNELKYPADHVEMAGQSIDLAFRILGPAPVLSAKWHQPPDLTPSGVDVYASFNMAGPMFPTVVADDFLCTQTGPISKIEFWGSWLEDIVASGVSFTLSIHDDLPGPPYSQPAPGDPRWSHTYAPGECEAAIEQSGTPEGFYTPAIGEYFAGADSVVWHYTCPGPDPEEFIQEGTPEQPVIYWLDVQALYMDPNPFVRFGWKTTPLSDRWHDDAAWALGWEPGPFQWAPLTYPAGHPYAGQSMDMAFRISGPAQADLEKVDLQVRPFYCGDSDMDGFENPSGGGGRVPAGTGNCCDGVDNDGNTKIDGQDQQCINFWGWPPKGGINEDGGAPNPWYDTWGFDDDLVYIDFLIDEDPGQYPSGQNCPWNGDDDCDGQDQNAWCDAIYNPYGIYFGDPQYCVDEDPKNNKDDDGDGSEAGFGVGTCNDGVDNDQLNGMDCADPTCAPKCDEDPANGFLGIDNDRDGLVDEDGGGRFDFNGNTMIGGCVGSPPDRFCEDQGEGIDDDGDTSVDEDPLDSPVAPDLPPLTKLVQAPDPTPMGWDVLATWFDDQGFGYALADDYVCNKTGSVTEIRFWGSWLNDVVPAGGPNNVPFTLSIHSDMPSPPEPYSHPGPTLWMRTYAAGECQIIGSMGAPETFRNPTGGQIGIDNMAYLYSCPLQLGEFPQQQGTIYWLDVQAHLNSADGVMFGWKTSPMVLNDSAVYAALPKPPAIEQGPWYEVPGKDLAFEILTQEVIPTHEPHYLVKEILVNHGPEPWVTAWDTKNIDAPAWRANALEDGRTTCNDGWDNDGIQGADAEDPDCLDPHIGEEQPGLHSCHDGLDNGGDGFWDGGDEECQTLTEVSVECDNPDDVITIKGGVPWYIKPSSTFASAFPGCEQYSDPAHFSKCVPCKFPLGVTPPEGLSVTCGELFGTLPGFCVAVDSELGVINELDFLQDVELGYRTHNMYMWAGSLEDPIHSEWGQLYPAEERFWELTSWEDDGNEILSAGDQIDMVDYSTGEKAWFHVDEVTDLVCVNYGAQYLCFVPIPPASIYQPPGPVGAWTLKYVDYHPEYYGQACDVWDWNDGNQNDEVDPGDQLYVNCPFIGPPTWVPVYFVYSDVWLSEKVVDEHQFDLACEGPTSLHRFTIGDLLEPQGVEDPNWPVNNHKETMMLVGCTSFAEASVHDLNVPLPDPLPAPPHWDVDVGYPESIPVSVFATNSGPAPADFVVSLEEESPGQWSGGIPPAEDPDNDGWATTVEGVLGSNPGVNASRPESLHALNDTTGQPSCNDGVDNDKNGVKDAADFKCVDSDGDGYSDLYERFSGSNPADPTKTPEHMQFPWSCGDGIDNDGDGFCDGGGCGLLPAEGNTLATGESLLDGDNFADCSKGQLGSIPPPVYCASGWAREDLNGDTRPDGTDADEYVHLAGDGSLTVGLNIPLNSLSSTIPVSRKLVLTCFLSKNPYPTETVWARIRAADVHVLDGNPDNNDVFKTFGGTASCKLGEVKLDIVSWVFDPPAAPADFHVDEEQVFQTTKTIRMTRISGPAGPVDVRVRKFLNVPVGCDGSVKASDPGETIEIPANTKWNVEVGHSSNPADWNDGPVTLQVGVAPLNNVGDVVYVRENGLDPAFWEIYAYFTRGVPESPPDATVVEDFDIYCRESGSKPFLFSNQITTGDAWPDICMTADSHIREDHGMSVNVQLDADGDTTPDAVDNCPDVPNPDQLNTDKNYPKAGDGPKGDACDKDDDNDGWEDNEPARAGGAGAGDAIGSDPKNWNKTPEVCDGVDNDGNEGVDEGFPDTTPGGPKDCVDNAYDADGDGSGNALDTNDDSWQVGGVWHNDMFPDTRENFAGTKKEVKCWTAGNPVDADPFDVYKDGKANAFDIMKFYEAPQAYGAKLYPDHDGYKRRLDLFFGPDMQINVFDIMQYYAAPAAYGNNCPYGK